MPNLLNLTIMLTFIGLDPDLSCVDEKTFSERILSAVSTYFKNKSKLTRLAITHHLPRLMPASQLSASQQRYQKRRVLRLRHQLQRLFLSRTTPPRAEDTGQGAWLSSQAEASHITIEALQESKLPKLLRRIVKATRNTKR